MNNQNAHVKATYPATGKYSAEYLSREKIGNTKRVFVMTGPQSSGKTIQMKKFADENGIHYTVVPWHLLDKTRQSYWKYMQKGPDGSYYLFVEEYDLQNQAANGYLDELTKHGVVILAASQTDPPDRELLPASFQVIKCDYHLTPR